MIEKINKVYFEFERWKGPKIKDDYNGKAVLDYNDEPLFAELVVLRKFQESGYDGVWVDNYRNTFKKELPEKNFKYELPDRIAGIFNELVKANGGRSGCWDLLCWNDKEIKFIELKRKNHDAIRESQIRWLENALQHGINQDSFLIVEWDIK